MLSREVSALKVACALLQYVVLLTRRCCFVIEIEDLSWVQKKRLDEVRKIMESKHGFKAS